MRRAITTLTLTVTLAIHAHAGVIDHTVYLHRNFFSLSPNPNTPSTNALTINAGQTVQWVWVDGFHSVLQTSGPGLANPFQSDLTSTPGFTFTHTFNTLGEYNYICEVHGMAHGGDMPMGMFGTITVIPTPASLAPLAAAALLATRRRR